VWFVLFGLGAAFLHRLPLPRPVSALPCPPPPEALYAIYFLLAALLRLAIRDARLASLERRARRAERRRGRGFGLPAPGLLEVGAGVGKGVADAILGDITGAALAGGALLLRMASVQAQPGRAGRSAAERRRAMTREHVRTLLCIVGVGVVCAAATAIRGQVIPLSTYGYTKAMRRAPSGNATERSCGEWNDLTLGGITR
jgi:hypothetical protein